MLATLICRAGNSCQEKTKPREGMKSLSCCLPCLRPATAGVPCLMLAMVTAFLLDLHPSSCPGFQLISRSLPKLQDCYFPVGFSLLSFSEVLCSAPTQLSNGLIFAFLFFPAIFLRAALDFQWQVHGQEPSSF